jgi:serine phosphatase RsbU (regulator of sigma subunit)
MEDYGEERLFAFAHALPRDLTAGQILQAVSEEVSRFTQGAEQADDITLVALKVL